MRHHVAVLGCTALLLVGVTACGRESQNVSAGGRKHRVTAASDPGSPPGICRDIEVVTGLPEKIAIATSAGNIEDLRTAVTDASARASEAKSDAPEELQEDLGSLAADLDGIDSALSTADPTAVVDDSVTAALGHIRNTYEGAAPLRLAQYQSSACE